MNFFIVHIDKQLFIEKIEKIKEINFIQHLKFFINFIYNKNKNIFKSK